MRESFKRTPKGMPKAKGSCCAPSGIFRFAFHSKVSQCIDYEERRLPDFDNMEEIAWQIRTKSAGRVAGFVTVPDENDSLEQEKNQADESVLKA